MYSYKLPSPASDQGGGITGIVDGVMKSNKVQSSSSPRSSGAYPFHSHQDLMPRTSPASSTSPKSKHVPAPFEFRSLKGDIDALLKSKSGCNPNRKMVVAPPTKGHNFLFWRHIGKTRSEAKMHKGKKHEDDEASACPDLDFACDLKLGVTLSSVKVNWSKLLDETLGPNVPSVIQQRLLNVAEYRLVDETFRFYMAILDYEREPTLAKARVMVELYVEAGAKFESGSISSQTRKLVIDIIEHKSQLNSKPTGQCFDAIKLELFRDIITNNDLGMIVMKAHGRDFLDGDLDGDCS